MRYSFRGIGLAVLVIALICRMNARMVLPSTYGYSGDFWSSEYGVRLTAFADTCNVFMLLGGLMFILSFTTLIRPAGSDGSAH